MMNHQIVQSVGIVLLNSQNKVLVGFKRMTKVWEFPQGTVEDKENLYETLKREVEEETGIKHFRLDKDFQTTTHYQFKREGKVFDKTVIYFLGITDEKVRLSEEHEQYRWCTFEEADRLFKHKNHKNVLRAAKKRLKILYGKN